MSTPNLPDPAVIEAQLSAAAEHFSQFIQLAGTAEASFQLYLLLNTQDPPNITRLRQIRDGMSAEVAKLLEQLHPQGTP